MNKYKELFYKLREQLVDTPEYFTLLEMCDKIGKYKNIEEKLNIDLIKLFYEPIDYDTTTREPNKALLELTNMLFRSSMPTKDLKKLNDLEYVLKNCIDQRNEYKEVLDILKPFVKAQQTLINNNVVAKYYFKKILEIKIINRWLKDERF